MSENHDEKRKSDRLITKINCAGCLKFDNKIYQKSKKIIIWSDTYEEHIRKDTSGKEKKILFEIKDTM